jgi:DNA-binding MarR family transcriptional regulator
MTASPPPSEDLFLLLPQVQGALKRLADWEFRRIGIGLSEYVFLRTVERLPHGTASDMRQRLGTSAPAVAQTVRALEGKHLIERRKDVRDIRRQRITLTKKGHSAVREARSILARRLRALELSDEKLAALQHQLAQLSAALTVAD